MTDTTASGSESPQNRVSRLVGHASSVKATGHLLELQPRWMSVDLEPEIDPRDDGQHRALCLQLRADLLVEPTLLAEAAPTHVMGHEQTRDGRGNQEPEQQ